ncbi:Vegetative incompatibility protein HET-E-1 [Ceratobasidium theobromae]|uniref:Vegetative incompatibility protein HET-E-1 n=1 Tax=Ceratobasidium theobromae TaxID=1582974 RepID=A0A5N5QJQ9_9AGAM|nr:Vegetative incompatibility protein HET-E-1 [Ceratobasidium theobromae]
MASPPPSGKPRKGFRKLLSETYHSIVRSPSPSGLQHSREASGSVAPPDGTNIVPVVGPPLGHSPSALLLISNPQPNSSAGHGISNPLDPVGRKIDKVGLKPALRGLHKTAIAFPPLQSAIGALIPCLDILEASSRNQEEYEAVASELKTLADSLTRNMKASRSIPISDSIARVALSIEQQANLIKDKQSRRKGRRLLEASVDEGDLVKNLRRIESLFRQLQTDATLSTWSIANEHLVNTRLRELKPASLARYDSELSTEINRRMCTENTRTSILSGLDDWSHDPGAADMYWMDGMAGTGKTTIACSFSRGLYEQKQLAASFFCSRTSPECRSVGRIVPTIAYQLARYSIPYQGALCEILGNDPDIGTTNIQTQFERLLIEPLMKVKGAMPDDPVVVIDALDECEDRRGVQRLLDLLFRSAAELPLKFFVTSRPEPEIYRKMVSRASDSRAILHLHEIEKSLVQADIALYLKEELGQFMTPTTGQIEQLSQRSGNLFIYAATLVRHVQLGEWLGDYEARLDSLLAASPRSAKLYAQLDGLYAAVLDSVLNSNNLDKEGANEMRVVLQTVVCAQEPLDLETLAALAGLDGAQRARTVIQPLRSVLHLSESNGLVSTLHASFPDFMFDGERSGPFFCEIEVHSYALARQCFRIMQAQLRFNICNLESSFVADKDVDDLQDRVTRSFMLVQIIRGVRSTAGGVFDNSAAVLDGGAEPEGSNGHRDGSAAQGHPMAAAEDARNLVTTFAANAISQGTPHIYTSLLPFCPKSNILSEHYRKRTHGLIEAKGTGVDRWDVMPLANWKTGSSPIFSMAYSPDRSRVVYGCMDGTIGIRSGYNGSLLVSPVKVHGGGGSRIVSGSDDCTIRMWDVNNGVPLASPFEGHTGGVKSVAFSPDGTRIVSGSADHTVRVWSSIDGALVAGPFTGHTDWVRSVAFSPDSTQVVSGSYDQTVRVWAADSGAPITDPFEGHTNWVMSVAFSPDGARIASGSSDRTIRVWNISRKTCVGARAILEGHTDSVTAVAFSLDGARIISGSYDCTIRVWNTLATTLTPSPPQGHTSWVLSIAFSPGRSHIASGSYDHSVRLWDIQTGTHIDDPLHGHTGAIRSVAFSPDGTLIASGSDDHTIRLWSLHDSSSVAKSFKGRTYEVLSVAFSSNSTQLVSCSSDGTIRVWNIPNGDLVIGPLSEHTDGVTSVMFSPDDTYIVSGSFDLTVRVWNTSDGTPAADPFEGHTQAIMSISVSPIGTLIASGSEDHTVRLWNLDGGTPATPPLLGHTAGVNSVAFSPDGARVISGSDDRTVRLWNSSDGTLIGGQFEGHTGPIWSVAFSSDGTFAVSGSSDGAIRFWDTRSDPSNTALLSTSTPSDLLLANSPTAYPFGRWSIGEYGWVTDCDHRLLFWAPLEILSSILTPHCYMVIGRFGSIKLDLSVALLGSRWQNCYVSD